MGGGGGVWGAEMLIHQAATGWYSWIRPPSTSRHLTAPPLTRVACCSRGWGTRNARPRCGVGAENPFISRGLGILMDQPTKSISSHDSLSRQDGSRLDRPEWRRLVQGTVRTVHVGVIGVLGQHRHQMPRSEDEHPVQHLPPNRAHPPLCIGVGPRGPHRCAQHPDPLGGNYRVKHSGELCIPIADYISEPADAVSKPHEQVPRLLCHPRPHWMRCHPEHVDPAGRHLDHVLQQTTRTGSQTTRTAAATRPCPR